MTPAERRMWGLILSKDKTSYRFLRQKVIANYIVDFYCFKLKLAIEIDGESHTENFEYDQKRTGYLNRFGVKVIRYTNDQVMKYPESVYYDLLEQIKIRGQELKLESA